MNHEVYRSYARPATTEWEAVPAPGFDQARRFTYDRDHFRSPTLIKLAHETIRQREMVNGLPGDRDWRVWIWRDNGELIGSVVCRVHYVPSITVDDKTIDRGLPA